MKTIKNKLKHFVSIIICLLSDCDGMCGLYTVCKYCQINKTK